MPAMSEATVSACVAGPDRGSREAFAPRDFSWTRSWTVGAAQRSFRKPLFDHPTSKQPLPVDGNHDFSNAVDEHLRSGFSARNQFDGTPADSLLSSLLWSCGRTKDLSRGTKLHHELHDKGFCEKHHSDALVTMYAKCGDLPSAQALLDKHDNTSVDPWNALIAGYTRHGKGQNALKCFDQMRLKGISPNSGTYSCVLKACAMVRALDKGKQIHYEISEKGLAEPDIVLSTALLDMYAKCGALTQAQTLLHKLSSRDVVAWNALIDGYAQDGKGSQAIECFEQMQHDSVLPNSTTYVSVLKGCAVIRAIDKGKQIHDEILDKGLLEQDIMLGSALVDMYVKCGALPQAKSILECLPSRNVVSWNTLIAGYVQNGQGYQALGCFEQMQGEGIFPDVVTYGCILRACGLIRAVDKGKRIHEEISKQGLLEHNIVLGNALVDMYAKCGSLSQAQCVLNNLPSRNVASWSPLITGYGQRGQVQEALGCFERMQEEGIPPDQVTFLCLLKLCNHLGLVEKGQELFDSMQASHGVKPNLECVACLVDLLGRAGHLVRAVQVIKGMPFPANSSIWHSLMGACWKWADANIGTWAFKQAIKLDSCDWTAHVLMKNIYAAAVLPDNAEDIRVTRIRNKALKLL